MKLFFVLLMVGALDANAAMAASSRCRMCLVIHEPSNPSPKQPHKVGQNVPMADTEPGTVFEIRPEGHAGRPVKRLTVGIFSGEKLLFEVGGDVPLIKKVGSSKEAVDFGWNKDAAEEVLKALKTDPKLTLRLSCEPKGAVTSYWVGTTQKSK